MTIYEDGSVLVRSPILGGTYYYLSTFYWRGMPSDTREGCEVLATFPGQWNNTIPHPFVSCFEPHPVKWDNNPIGCATILRGGFTE